MVFNIYYFGGVEYLSSMFTGCFSYVLYFNFHCNLWALFVHYRYLCISLHCDYACVSGSVLSIMSFSTIVSTSFHHIRRMSISCISCVLFALWGASDIIRLPYYLSVSRIIVVALLPLVSVFVYRIIYRHCCQSCLPLGLVISLWHCCVSCHVPSGLVRLSSGSSYITTVVLLPSIVSAYAFSVSVFGIFIVISYLCLYSHSLVLSAYSYSHLIHRIRMSCSAYSYNYIVFGVLVTICIRRISLFLRIRLAYYFNRFLTRIRSLMPLGLVSVVRESACSLLSSSYLYPAYNHSWVGAFVVLSVFVIRFGVFTFVPCIWHIRIRWNSCLLVICYSYSSFAFQPSSKQLCQDIISVTRVLGIKRQKTVLWFIACWSNSTVKTIIRFQ